MREFGELHTNDSDTWRFDATISGTAFGWIRYFDEELGKSLGATLKSAAAVFRLVREVYAREGKVMFVSPEGNVDFDFASSINLLALQEHVDYDATECHVSLGIHRQVGEFIEAAAFENMVSYSDVAEWLLIVYGTVYELTKDHTFMLFEKDGNTKEVILHSSPLN